MSKLTKIQILLLVVAFSLILSAVYIYYEATKNASQINDKNTKGNVGNTHSAYENINKGVGFVLSEPKNLRRDFGRANDVGLVILNAPYEGDGKIPDIVQLGFKFTDFPVPNMAKDTSDPIGLKNAYLSLVKEYDPYYIGVGNEIELMPDIEEFIPLYNEIYESLKHECPTCLVYPTFQYESFDISLAKELKLDLLVLTSYPFSKYANFNQIPQNYYQEAFDFAAELNIDLAFSEIGWTHLPAYQSGYSSSQEAQVAFYEYFTSLIEKEGVDRDVNVKFVSWGLLYDAPQVGIEWAEMGLYTSEGSAREALIKAVK